MLDCIIFKCQTPTAGGRNVQPIGIRGNINAKCNEIGFCCLWLWVTFILSESTRLCYFCLYCTCTKHDKFYKVLSLTRINATYVCLSVATLNIEWLPKQPPTVLFSKNAIFSRCHTFCCQSWRSETMDCMYCTYQLCGRSDKKIHNIKSLNIILQTFCV